MRKLRNGFAGAFLLSALTMPAAAADTAPDAAAIAAFANGQVLDAIAILEKAIVSEKDLKARWSLSSLLMDLCTYSYQYQCVVRNAKAFAETGDALREPRLTAGRVVFVGIFERYLAGDTKLIRENFGADFSLKIANPLQDPVLATRFFLLNAAVEQYDGRYDEARKYINRAFASLLRVDTDKNSYEAAVLLKEAILSLYTNHDYARAMQWLTIAVPFFGTTLPRQGFDSAAFLNLAATVQTTVGNFPLSGQGYGLFHDAVERLQIDPAHKEALLAEAVIAQAATLAAQGDFAGARRKFDANPIRARRGDILKSGAFRDYYELYTAAAEVFFDQLSGAVPDEKWKPLFQKTGDWNLSREARGQTVTYRDAALAILENRTDPAKARQMFNGAIAGRLRAFESQRSDTTAFPLPSLLDRLILGFGASYWSTASGEDSDLLIASMELLNRNPRYVVSDTLSTFVAQKSGDERRAARALLRLRDNQQSWERNQLQALVERVAARRPFPAKDFSAQFVARDYDEAIQALSPHIHRPEIRLPTKSQLQAALGESEAFIGYVSGIRVCVRKGGIWGERVFGAASQEVREQFLIDRKVLVNALTAQNAPSDAQDSQYPVEAAIRLQKTLFGGFDACLAGAKHVIFFSPSDVAAIPLGALLRAAPPRLGTGYDLSQAHWLIFDHAFSNVVSIRDFLSSRALSRNAGGNRLLAGIGDPRLANSASAVLKDLKELPETAEELQAISGIVGGRATLLTRAKATEEQFRALPLGHYEILHFATHGLVRGEISGLDQAALVLTPKDMANDQNDGLLTTSEIANLGLSARLVVLSACNTANFDPTAFNARLQSFASAFAVAGVPATVASLWSVESQTSMRLMQAFYKHLISPAAPQIAVALQRAIIDTVRSPPSRAFLHPRFWAPFILTGDGAAGISVAKQDAAYQEAVSVRDGGGDILGAVEDDGVLITSEIGPARNGQHSSLVVAHDAQGKILWSVEDREIGAGKIVRSGQGYVVAGYKWSGRAIPVLRRFSRTGTLEWTVEPRSSAPSAMVGTVSASSDGVWIVLHPLDRSQKAYDMDVVRYSVQGTEIDRRSIPQTPDSSQGRTFVSTEFGGKFYLAVNNPGTSFETVRDSFGFVAICGKGAAVSLYELDGRSDAAPKVASFANLQFSQLTGLRGQLIYAGASLGFCANGRRHPVLGAISPDLKSAKLWEDGTAFSGSLVGVVEAPSGYLGVAQFLERTRFSQDKVDENGMRIAPQSPSSGAIVKHLDFENDQIAEAAVLRFDGRFVLRSTSVLGSGLAQYAAGLARGADGATVYGTSGFNPWLERVP
ncbi:MAG TPA: CHAT domain-containing protein [Rhizomicrobium sp.]|nr:CHAT domain-containing protein [Rhizomicrobium sp.]